MLTTATLLEALASPPDKGRQLRLELACLELACPELATRGRGCCSSAHTRLANRLAAVAPRLGAWGPQSEAVRLALGVILALHRVEADAEAQGEAPL